MLFVSAASSAHHVCAIAPRSYFFTLPPTPAPSDKEALLNSLAFVWLLENVQAITVDDLIEKIPPNLADRSRLSVALVDLATEGYCHFSGLDDGWRIYLNADRLMAHANHLIDTLHH